jgi:hypothetical protein
MIKIIRNDADSFWFFNQAGLLCLKIAGTNQAYQSDGAVIEYTTASAIEYVDVTVTIEYAFPVHDMIPFEEIKVGCSFLWGRTPYIKINQRQCINLFTGELCCFNNKDCQVYDVKISFTYFSDAIVNFRQGEWYLLSNGQIILALTGRSLFIPETNEVICAGGADAVKRLKPVIKVILKDDAKVSYKDLGTGASFLHNDGIYVRVGLDSVNISNVSPGDIYRYDEKRVRLVDLEVIV